MTYSASTRPRPRKDGTVAHDVRFRQDGRSRTISFDTPVAAERWANILRQIGPVEALALLQATTQANLPTVAEYAEIYIGTKSGVEPRTLEHYRMYMRVSINDAMGSLPLDAVSSATISGWVNDQSAKGFAPKTIKNRHGFLAAMFQHAQDAGLIPRNPCAKTGLPESEQEEMTFLSPAEFRQLLEYIPEPSKLLVRFLAATGTRWSEATALQPKDFDFTAGTVRISRAWKSSTGSGYYLGAPKTKKSRRTISLPASLIPEIKVAVKAAETFVFVNRDGAPIRQAKFWEGVWNPARRLANGLPAYDGRTPRTGSVWAQEPAQNPLGKNPRVHDLRHTHASWLLNDGVPINVIQRRLGHESIQTTVDTYGHIAPDMMALAARSIDNSLTM